MDCFPSATTEVVFNFNFITQKTQQLESNPNQDPKRIIVGYGITTNANDLGFLATPYLSSTIDCIVKSTLALLIDPHYSA
eukprot:15328118-Ditylum_brightwellii.AAC.2